MQELFSTHRSSLEVGSFEKLFPQEVLPNYSDLVEECTLNHRPKIFVYGRECRQKRNVGFFTDDPRVEGYRYSGQIARALPLTATLSHLTKLITKKFDTNHNAILVNQYVDGKDVIGAHSDDEKTLGNGGVIALSIYEDPSDEKSVRTFRIKEKGTKKPRRDVPLKHGEFVIMKGDFQSEFTHEIPQRASAKSGRISLTWRYHTS